MGDDDEDESWPSFCLAQKVDRRLERAVRELSWSHPTLVQRAAIPVGLEGRDLLIQARTGSGKTACYALPVLQSILRLKDEERRLAMPSPSSGVLAIVLAPTRELVAQARQQLVSLASYCRDHVRIVALMGQSAEADAKAVVGGGLVGDVLAATPAALREACDFCAATRRAGEQQQQHPLTRLGETVLAFVVDEADLVLSFGYNDDMDSLLERIGLLHGGARGGGGGSTEHPLRRRPQGILLSATLGDDVAALKRVALRRAATVRLRESSGVFGGDRDDEGALAQYFVPVAAADKELVLYVLLKLGLLEGRGILFVNEVDACYRLKLFLDLFSIRCLVLNAELPLASRLHTIESYNRGYYDLLVATDASVTVGEEATPAAADEQQGGGDDDDDDDDQGSATRRRRRGDEDKKKKRKRRATDDDDDDGEAAADDGFGVSRGIDFQNVKWVLNVDFPKTSASYTHRVGRTARAGARGTALSLVATDRAADLDALREVQDSQPPFRAAALAAGGACSVVAAIGASSVADHVQGSSSTLPPRRERDSGGRRDRLTRAAAAAAAARPPASPARL